jgi:hypothetical protein
MATGANAIKVVATSTGLLQSTVGRAARALREAGKDQWPQALPGGGKNSRPPQLHHLVNLALALSAEPLSAASEIVAGLRRLEPSPEPGSSQILPGPTLGEAFDLLVDGVSRPQVVGDEWPFDGFSITISRLGNRRPIAVLKAHSKYNMLHQPDAWCNYMPSLAELDTSLNGPYYSLSKTTVIGIGLISTLGSLWADTCAKTASDRPIGVAGYPAAVRNAPRRPKGRSRPQSSRKT